MQRAICLVFFTVLSLSSVSFAQQTPFAIDAPVANQTVTWPLEIKGRVITGAKVEFRLDGVLVGTIFASRNGVFSKTLNPTTPPPTAKITVTRILSDKTSKTLEVQVVTANAQKPDPPNVVVKTPVQQPKVKPTVNPKETPKEKPKQTKKIKPVLTPTPVANNGFFNRFGSELIWGSLFGIGGGVVGGLVAWQVSNNAFGEEAAIKRFAIISGAYLGSSLTLPLGIYTGGRLGDGDGSFIATLAMGYLTTTGALLFALDDDTSTGVALTTLAIAPWVGAFLGYELSGLLFSDDDKTPIKNAHLGIMPTNGGASVDISWAF